MARRKRTRNVLPVPLEKDLQKSCIRFLKLLGYLEPEYCGPHNGVLLVFGTHRRKGDYQGTMQSAGIPDLWIEGIGFVELKRERRSKTSAAQQLLVDRGHSSIVRTVEELQTLIKVVRENR